MSGTQFAMLAGHFIFCTPVANAWRRATIRVPNPVTVEAASSLGKGGRCATAHGAGRHGAT